MIIKPRKGLAQGFIRRQLKQGLEHIHVKLGKTLRRACRDDPGTALHQPVQPRPKRGIRHHGVQSPGQFGQLQAQPVDLLQFGDVSIGDKGAHTVDRLHQPLVLQPCQHPPQGRAADAEFLGQIRL